MSDQKSGLSEVVSEILDIFPNADPDAITCLLKELPTKQDVVQRLMQNPSAGEFKSKSKPKPAESQVSNTKSSRPYNKTGNTGRTDSFTYRSSPTSGGDSPRPNNSGQYQRNRDAEPTKQFQSQYVRAENRQNQSGSNQPVKTQPSPNNAVKTQATPNQTSASTNPQNLVSKNQPPQQNPGISSTPRTTNPGQGGWSQFLKKDETKVVPSQPPVTQSNTTVSVQNTPPSSISTTPQTLPSKTSPHTAQPPPQNSTPDRDLGSILPSIPVERTIHVPSPVQISSPIQFSVSNTSASPALVQPLPPNPSPTVQQNSSQTIPQNFVQPVHPSVPQSNLQGFNQSNPQGFSYSTQPGFYQPTQQGFNQSAPQNFQQTYIPSPPFRSQSPEEVTLRIPIRLYSIHPNLTNFGTFDPDYSKPQKPQFTISHSADQFQVPPEDTNLSILQNSQFQPSTQPQPINIAPTLQQQVSQGVPQTPLPYPYVQVYNQQPPYTYYPPPPPLNYTYQYTPNIPRGQLEEPRQFYIPPSELQRPPQGTYQYADPRNLAPNVPPQNPPRAPANDYYDLANQPKSNYPRR